MMDPTMRKLLDELNQEDYHGIEEYQGFDNVIDGGVLDVNSLRLSSNSN